MALDFRTELHVDEVKHALSSQIYAALEACGIVAEGYAKGLCPVDTGHLRNSITHNTDAGKKEVQIGSNVEYAPYVELGTGVHYPGGRRTPWIYTDSKGQTHMTNGQRAKPYIKPAVSDHLDEYRSYITSKLKGE